MSTVTLVKCDGCGVQIAGTLERVSIEATGSFADMQMGMMSSNHRATRLLVSRGGVSAGEHYDRLDYCSAKCAAKHLGGVKP